MRTSTGLSTEAVCIFNNMLRKLAKSYAPEYMADVFESGAPVARMAEFAEYKANRVEMPPDLGEQIRHVVAVQHQDAEFGVCSEFRDPDGLAPQDPLGIFRRVRPAPEPHDLWRRSYGCGEFVEI